MKKDIFVKDMGREGLDIQDSFIVAKKGVFSSKNNTKYLSVELRDRTGIIEGRVWDNVDELSRLFEKNDLVSVRAKTRIYQEKPQLTITDIRRVEEEASLMDMRAFLPESAVGIDKLKAEFFQLLNEIKDPHIASLFSVFTRKNDILEKFLVFPASIGVHHMYMGGLLEHSLSVAYMGKHAAETMAADKDIVVAGSLLHDIGKIEEMEVRGGFKYADKGRLLGHIALGVVMLEGLVQEVKGFPEHIADMLAHIIVSHHGVEEWGSPKKPMSIEALIVHYLDDLDAKVMGVKEHMKENMADEKWTEYHKLYESRFYKLPER